MGARDTILELARMYVPQLPQHCVWIAGIVLALVRWRKHPNVSLLALLAYGAYVVLTLVNPLVWRYVFSPLANRADARGQIEIIFAVFGFAWSCAYAIPGLLLLAAVFGWRRPATAPPIIPDTTTWPGP